MWLKAEKSVNHRSVQSRKDLMTKIYRNKTKKTQKHERKQMREVSGTRGDGYCRKKHQSSKNKKNGSSWLLNLTPKLK